MLIGKSDTYVDLCTQMAKGSLHS